MTAWDFQVAVRCCALLCGGCVVVEHSVRFLSQLELNNCFSFHKKALRARACLAVDGHSPARLVRDTTCLVCNAVVKR